jgi:tetratricopeptide (TPR) repeat protein
MSTSETKGSLADYVAAVKLGDTLMSDHKFDEAVKAFTNAVELRPEMYEAYFKLGSAHMNREDLLAAVTAYNLAYNIQPRDIGLLVRISEICFRMNDFYRAAEVLTEVLLIDDHYLPALCVLPELLIKIGRVDEALALLKAAIPEQSHVWELWAAAGIAATAKGEIEKAVSFYQEALAINPEANLAKYNLEKLQGQLEAMPVAGTA